jgi:predicted alpha/beta superfamily hydrolase
MKTILTLLLLISLGSAFKDHQHYSKTFDVVRDFRVFIPADYDSGGTKTYPVIYYCHGCGGTYESDQYRSYMLDGGYLHPYQFFNLQYTKPYCGDFEMYTDSNDVIVVNVNGRIEENTDGCRNWYPSDKSPGNAGKGYNFSRYMRELIQAVDSLYKTKAEPRYRAITGLSMGGHAALWLSATNPHLFRSASSFCHSPSYWEVGTNPNVTPRDVTQLWRCYRGLSMRTSANDQDYLYQYSQQMGVVLEGAGFENEYHEADFWRHWAADVDAQFDFHMRTFETPKPEAACFSHINFYPDFEVWGYEITSNKAENGWIYLRDVTTNSLGIHTRFRLPHGFALSEFDITVKTPPVYNPGASYRLVRYDYRMDNFSVSDIAPDTSGALSIVSKGGMGEEFGIQGDTLAPPVAVLVDTFCETVFLETGKQTALSFDVVNLSEQPVSSVTLRVSTECTYLTLSDSQKTVPTIPALSRITVDSLALVTGEYREFYNIGYIKIHVLINGEQQDKAPVIQVHITDTLKQYSGADVIVLDDRTVDGLVYTLWGNDNVLYEFGMKAGTGDGDGIAEMDEEFVMRVRLPKGYAPDDSNSFHPVVPVNIGTDPGPDLVNLDYLKSKYNRGRCVLSALMSLNRRPTEADPMEIPFFTELIYKIPSPGSDKDIDSYTYRYGRIVLPLDTIISIEKGADRMPVQILLDNYPNPFNPATRITYALPKQKCESPSLTIFSLSGRIIKVFSSRTLLENQGCVRWHGMDSQGRRVAAGVYLCRLRYGKKSIQKRIIFLP